MTDFVRLEGGEFIVNLDKAVAWAGRNDGVWSDGLPKSGHSLFGLPVTTSAAKRLRDQGGLYVHCNGEWREQRDVSLRLSTGWRIALRLGKPCEGRYAALLIWSLEDVESYFIRCEGADPFDWTAVKAA